MSRLSAENKAHCRRVEKEAKRKTWETVDECFPNSSTSRGSGGIVKVGSSMLYRKLKKDRVSFQCQLCNEELHSFALKPRLQHAAEKHVESSVKCPFDGCAFVRGPVSGIWIRKAFVDHVKV